ncbi:MAG: Holliday junction branch migration protein RuvA [Chloroflexi bacterium]|nr:Holliday junction branch migration protein RuvA [Chloroflexota bacterium]MBI5291581.1 Holliday junction branch migration protein RuvA [Chloroflexota bacterium]
MISSLRGIVQHIETDFLIVEVGGAGLKVFAPSGVLQGLDGVGHLVFLHTHLVVREDALTLYGFATEEQRILFETLLGVNGVGPRLAMAVLSYVSPDNLRRAVGNDQPEVLDRVPGVGKKTAEKIVFHLKDKFGAGFPLGPGTPFSDLDTEIVGALTALGYSIVEAQSALQSIPKDAPRDTEERVRLALQYFAKP